MEPDLKILSNKMVTNILIGDNAATFEDGTKYKMRYLSGSDIISLFEIMGLEIPQNPNSRWAVMSDFITSSINSKCINKALTLVFKQINLTSYINISGPLEDKMDYLSSGFVYHINQLIFNSGIHLEWKNNQIIVIIDNNEILDSPLLDSVDSNQIKTLKKRCERDLTNGDYDSVLTKTRSMLEELFINIIGDEYDSKKYGGNITSMFDEILKKCSIDGDGCPKPIREMISALHIMIQSIAKLRNDFSESHGHGDIKVTISESEAILAMNSAITIAEYIISIYQSKSPLNQRIYDKRLQ